MNKNKKIRFQGLVLIQTLVLITLKNKF